MGRSTYSSYGVALGALVAVVGLRFALDPILHDSLPLFFLVGAIATAGWFAGWRAAGMVTVLGYVGAQYFFLAPRGEFALSSSQDIATLIAYLLGSLTIVSVGRAWEKRYRSTQRQIESLLLDRAGEIETIRVELARRAGAASAADAAKNEFLANVRHELRTPLNSIIGFTSLLRESPLNEEQRRQLDFANAAACQLLGKLDAIIGYSDLAAGNVVLSHERFAVGAVLAEVHASVRAAAAAKGLDLTIIDETRGLRVIGDRVRLRQAIAQLASNAVKFTERGRVGLVATTAPGDGDAVTLRFEVKDTGIGLAADSVEPLFQPFRTAHSAVASGDGSNGLGLAVARQTARLMGGDVVVQSAPGAGSTFCLTATVRLA